MVQPLHQGSGEVSLRPASCWKFVSDQVEHVCRKSRSIYLSALAVMQLATKARPSPRCQLCQGSGAKKVAGNDLSCGHDASKSGYCVHGTVVPCVKTHSPVIVRSSYGTCGTVSARILFWVRCGMIATSGQPLIGKANHLCNTKLRPKTVGCPALQYGRGQS